MGFRSVFISADTGPEIPEWFYQEWQRGVHFSGKWRDGMQTDELPGWPIAAKHEAKLYDLWARLVDDLARLCRESTMGEEDRLVFIWLHECDGITKMEIDGRGHVRWADPTDWIEVTGSTHSYCYGCSDIDRARKVEA